MGLEILKNGQGPFDAMDFRRWGKVKLRAYVGVPNENITAQ